MKTRLTKGLAVLVLAGITGCANFGADYGCNIPAIPANRLPPELLGRSREDMVQISITRLRQNPPALYQLGPNDVLGIYHPNIVGVEEATGLPPVHFPEAGDQAPSVGFPIPVREDGTVPVPLIPPVQVEGLTVKQATDAIREAYRNAPNGEIKTEGILVTLMRRREYRVTVIREESGSKENVTKRGTGQTVDLPAYENDVLHALNETGGMPGLDAKNEIYVIRGVFEDGLRHDLLMAQIMACRQPCECPPKPPQDPNITVIPLRYYPENVPQFTEKDIILNTGDVVYIPSREQDRFYTGGAMSGGEHLLPRDYDIDVLGAVAIAGGQVGSGGTGVSRIGGQGMGGGSMGAQSSGKNPSRLIVIRKLPCGGQIPIQVNMNRALVDERERILVQPEDTLILRYTLCEELYNAALNLVQFNFLFNGFSGGGF